jgi:hypothetical protein
MNQPVRPDERRTGQHRQRTDVLMAGRDDRVDVLIINQVSLVNCL